MVAQPLGPVYNNLIHFDPHKYPEIIGDLAKSWTVSDDYLSYTFKLQEGEVSRWQRARVGGRQGRLGSDRLSFGGGNQSAAQ